MTGPASDVCSSFVNVTDPRLDRGHNHDLLEMIFIALTATLCGADGWVDVERFAKAKQSWFLQFLTLEHGVPSHDTFGRVFARLDTAEFFVAMHNWVDRFAHSLRGKGVAIDGKVLRGSFDRAAGKSPLHTITAFATETRLCLRQLSVDEKSNEIPAVPVMLRLLELEGAVVTLDALHCQKQTAAAIIDAKADYVITIKRNQKTLCEAIAELFVGFGEDDYKDPKVKCHTTKERSHGREEIREYYVSKVPRQGVFNSWPGIRSVGMVYRKRISNGKTQEETSFFITSMQPKVKVISKFIRDHWKIENSQHYILDVAFAEDASRIRKGTAPDIAAGFRRMALNILQRDTSIKDAIRGKRLRAGWDDNVLLNIFTAFKAA